MLPTPSRDGKAKVVVATTVALSFISFWRGASIVLSDLASSAFYAGGIAEQAIGTSGSLVRPGRDAVQLRRALACTWKAAACSCAAACTSWCATAWARSWPRLSVSSLVFDYILTGPISVVSAGQYLGRLLNEIAEAAASSPSAFNVNLFAAGFGRSRHDLFLVAEHQGHARIERQGAAHHADHHRDGGDPADLVPAHHPASRRRANCRPRPLPRNLHFSDEALGWFKGTILAARSRSSRSSSPSATRCCR